MTTNEFKAKLQSLIDLGDDFSAIVYFAMSIGDGIILKKANITREVLAGIADGFKDTLTSELLKFEQDDHMAVLNLSDRDDRANAIYRYDLDGVMPSYFSIMKEPITENADTFTDDRMFSFDIDTFSDIEYFVVQLGTDENQIVIYRDNFNVNLMKQSRGRFYLNKSGTQISQINDDILRMDSQIDCILIDEDFYIVNLKNLDTSKEFATIIKERANASIDIIAALPYIDNVDGLKGRLDELAFARRLMTAIESSPVIHLPQEQVLGFARQHTKLKKYISENKFRLDSKRAHSAFISMLNDDYLHSILTDRDYETSSKNRVKNE